jgi:hypothetical protein
MGHLIHLAEVLASVPGVIDGLLFQTRLFEFPPTARLRLSLFAVRLRHSTLRGPTAAFD